MNGYKLPVEGQTYDATIFVKVDGLHIDVNGT
jgi:hypothetical protein